MFFWNWICLFLGCEYGDMSDECNHGGLCYLESNRPVCCALCAAAATNVTGTKCTNTRDDKKVPLKEQYFLS